MVVFLSSESPPTWGMICMSISDLCRDVSDITKAPEMLGGRVKTLHPAVHGGKRRILNCLIPPFSSGEKYSRHPGAVDPFGRKGPQSPVNFSHIDRSLQPLSFHRNHRKTGMHYRKCGRRGRHWRGNPSAGCGKKSRTGLRPFRSLRLQRLSKGLGGRPGGCWTNAEKQTRAQGVRDDGQV